MLDVLNAHFGTFLMSNECHAENVPNSGTESAPSKKCPCFFGYIVLVTIVEPWVGIGFCLEAWVIVECRDFSDV